MSLGALTFGAMAEDTITEEGSADEASSRNITDRMSRSGVGARRHNDVDTKDGDDLRLH